MSITEFFLKKAKNKRCEIFFQLELHLDLIEDFTQLKQIKYLNLVHSMCSIMLYIGCGIYEPQIEIKRLKLSKNKKE